MSGWASEWIDLSLALTQKSSNYFRQSIFINACLTPFDWQIHLDLLQNLFQQSLKHIFSAENGPKDLKNVFDFTKENQFWGFDVVFDSVEIDTLHTKIHEINTGIQILMIVELFSQKVFSL